MRCSSCTQEVPDGVFCTRCGAHQATTQQAGNLSARVSHYAAHPGEHVLHPGIFTTLFPHLGQHKVHEFRWAFLVGVAAIFVLDVAGMVSAALLAAALLIPVLYLVYLYEAQVYRDAPAQAIGFTIGGGLILGLVVTIIVNHFYPSYTLGGPLGSSATALVTLCVIVPLIQEVLKPLPALALRETSDFRETADGLVFGVAAGLGFAMAGTIVNFSDVLQHLPVRTDPANWIYPLVTAAVTLPLLQGSATGAITAAIWRMRRGNVHLRDFGAVGIALVAHVGFTLVSQLLSDRGLAQQVILAWQGAVDGALLIYIRYALHHALLQEGADMGFAETICPNCHHHISAAGFCPSCGKALAASPLAGAAKEGVTADTPLHRLHGAAIVAAAVAASAAVTVIAAVFLRNSAISPQPVVLPTPVPSAAPTAVTPPAVSPNLVQGLTGYSVPAGLMGGGNTALGQVSETGKAASRLSSTTGLLASPASALQLVRAAAQGCKAGAGGQITTNTFCLTIPSTKWKVEQHDNVSASLFLDDGSAGAGLVYVEAGTVKSPTSGAGEVQSLYAGEQKSSPDIKLCGSKPFNAKIGGIEGLAEGVCFTMTPQSGQPFPVYDVIWGAANAAGTTIYGFELIVTPPDSSQVGKDNVALISTVHWLVGGAATSTPAQPTVSCSGSGTVLSTGTFCLVLGSTWSVLDKGNSYAWLQDTLKQQGGSGLLLIVSDAPGKSPFSQGGVSALKQGPGISKVRACGASFQLVVGGVTGNAKPYCFTITPKGGSAFAGAATLWFAENASKSTEYGFLIERAQDVTQIDQDSLKVLSTLQWVYR